MLRLKAGITKSLNLGLVQKPSLRVDLQNRNWVLSYYCSIMFNSGVHF